MGFIERLQSKLELYRLEQRYTRRRNRTTFATDAVYVDGEYVFNNSLTSNLRSSSPPSPSTGSPSLTPPSHTHTQSAPVSHRPSVRERQNPRYTFDETKAYPSHQSNYSYNYTPTDYESPYTGLGPRRDGKPYYSFDTTVTGGVENSPPLPQRRASKRASVMDGSWMRKSAGIGVRVRELVVPERERTRV